MDKQSIYLISAGVVFILFVIFLIILLKKKRVINLQKQVQELERQRNLIVSTPIAAELAKIEVIVKNEKLESKYEEWKERYRVIKENRFQVITDMLLEIDGLIDANDIKNAMKIASSYNLFMSGGTDTHGYEGDDEVKLGVGYGSMCIPDSIVEPWVQKLIRRK